MPSINVNFDRDALVRGLERKLNQTLEKGLSDRVKYFAASSYRDVVAEYVPIGPSYKGHTGGALWRSAFKKEAIVKDGDGYAVRYSAKGPPTKKYPDGYDYASFQYNNDFMNRHTPGTYGHWNRHLTQAQRQEWYQEVADEMKREMQNGQK